MKRETAILLAFYVVLEAIYTLIGSPESTIWVAIYFLNQSVLIIGLLTILKAFVTSVLVEVGIALNVVKCLYNILDLFKPELTIKVNMNYYVGLCMVVAVILILTFHQIWKR